MTPFYQSLVETFASVMAASIVAFGIRLLHELALKARASRWATEWNVLSDAVDRVVVELAVRVVPDLKAQNGDGKLTKEQADHLVTMAIERALNLAGKQVAKAAEKHGLGFNALGTLVEAAVEDRRPTLVPPGKEQPDGG